MAELRGPVDWFDWLSCTVELIIDLVESDRFGDLLDEIFDLLRGGG